MRELLRSLNQRPISYYPVYRDIVGSTTGGIVLSQLMYWFSKKDKIFKTDADIIDETHLTQNELRGAKNLLKELDFLEISREGVPAKTYYKIDWKKYEKALKKPTKKHKLNSQNKSSEKQQTSSVKSTNTVELNPPTQISEIHETNKNKSLTETTTETTTENNLSISSFVVAQEIISHLNQLLGTNYKPDMVKTKLLIEQRLKEGFSVDDFKKVHLIKFAEWNGTNMHNYLRPETLYSSKFERYLNQRVSDYEKFQALQAHTGLSALEYLEQQGMAS